MYQQQYQHQQKKNNKKHNAPVPANETSIPAPTKETARIE
jgi:hypothetical protein